MKVRLSSFLGRALRLGQARGLRATTTCLGQALQASKARGRALRLGHTRGPAPRLGQVMGLGLPPHDQFYPCFKYEMHVQAPMGVEPPSKTPFYALLKQ